MISNRFSQQRILRLSRHVIHTRKSLQKNKVLSSSLEVIEHRGTERTENKSNSVPLCSNLSTSLMSQIVLAIQPLYDFCGSIDNCGLADTSLLWFRKNVSLLLSYYLARLQPFGLWSLVRNSLVLGNRAIFFLHSAKNNDCKKINYYRQNHCRLPLKTKD